MARGLTPKQQRFVEEYPKAPSATQAAIRAGYGKNGVRSAACRLLTNRNVMLAIEENRQKLEARHQISEEWVLESIYETGERCRQAAVARNAQGEPVMVETANGELAAAYKFDASNALKAAELAGKHLRMFTDRVEIGGNVTFNLNFAGQPGTLIEGEAVEVTEIEGED